MNIRQRLPFLRKKFTFLLKQNGQTLVEFVLLLAVVATISYGFVALVNHNLGKYWEHCVNLVVNDGDPNKPKVVID